MTVPKRFGVLRLLGTLMKVLAWLILIAAVIFAISVGILFQFVPDLAQINWWTHLLLVIIPILENAQVDTTNLATGGGIITGIIKSSNKLSAHLHRQTWIKLVIDKAIDLENAIA